MHHTAQVNHVERLGDLTDIAKRDPPRQALVDAQRVGERAAQQELHGDEGRPQVLEHPRRVDRDERRVAERSEQLRLFGPVGVGDLRRQELQRNITERCAVGQ